MLQAMRTGAKSTVMKIFLFGLLLMAMAGLALMDVQGMVRGGSRDAAVATIGRERITTAQFEQIAGAKLRQQNIPREVAASIGMPQQILSQEISTRVFARAARDMGLIADDKAAADSVRQILQPLIQQGLTEQDAFARLLSGTGMSEPALVASLKTQIASEMLIRLVSSGAQAPKALIEAALKYRNEARRAEYFILTPADAGKAREPSDAELAAYYKTVEARFALPEYRSFDVLVLDAASLSGGAKASEADLKKYYDDHILDYTTPETRMIAQVVAKDEAAARAVHDAAVKSKDLQKAAGANAYIKPQAVTEKDMPVELSPAAFKGAAGAVLEPVKSPLGWHVMHVAQVTPATVKSFDAVKADIAKTLSADKSAEALYEQAGRIDDMVAGGASLDDVAKEFGLKTRRFNRLDAGAKPDNAPAAFDKALEQAFRLDKGETGQMIEAQDGTFLLVSLADIFPPETQPLEKVRGAVLESWKAKESSDLVDKQAAKISERLKLGEPFAKIAKDFGKTAQATDFITRAADAEKLKLGRGFIPALFSLDKPGGATTAGIDGNVAVIRFAARRTEPQKDMSKEDRAALEATLNRALQNDILDQYRAVLFDKYDVTVNDKAVQDMFRPKDEEDVN